MDVQLLPNPEISKSLLSVKSGAAKEKNVKVDGQADLQQNQKVDTYQHTHQEKKVTYDKPTIKSEPKSVEQLMAESENAFGHLKQIVGDMLKRQGLKFRDLKDIKVEDVKTETIDDIAQKEAQAMIAEGGEYSAENVSDRIVDFAKAISGGDKSKLELLRSAIEDGFGAATKDFGAELPEITKETHQLIMDKLDAWANEGKTPEGEADIEVSSKLA